MRRIRGGVIRGHVTVGAGGGEPGKHVVHMAKAARHIHVSPSQREFGRGVVIECRC